MPAASIIIATYNRGYILGNAIKSVRRQTNGDWELIVVDDGSTDTTADLIEAVADPRIRYFHQENGGPSAARNTGLLQAAGQWVAYLDSDNELYPTYLEDMLSALAQRPGALYAWSMGDRTQELYQGGQLIKSIDDSKEFFQDITPQHIFLRKVHADTTGLMQRWDEQLRRFEDWDFFMQIAGRHPDAFVYVKKKLFHYHQRFGGDGIVSNSTYQDWADGFEYIYQKHKHSILLEGQNWYPAKVRQYEEFQRQYQNGNFPDPTLRYFS